MGTAVFRRITEEYESKGFAKGFEVARSAAVKALKDTMQKETVRFGTFNDQYVEGCAADRLDFYVRDPNATCTNQIYPAAD